MLLSAYRSASLLRRGGLVALTALVGCYPGSTDLDDEDYDVVITVHDDEVDFSTYRTYALPDTVIHIEESDDNDVIELPRDFDDLIVDVAAANMDALGYVREFDPEANGVDLILLASAVGTESTEWFYGGWWGYWGWYPGYPPGWGPGWGWGVPPGYIGGVRIEQGSVVLTLIDPTLADEDEETVPVVWAGAMRGLLSGGGAESRITESLNQAFDQSPYLGN
jgi:hypothetical protein